MHTVKGCVCCGHDMTLTTSANELLNVNREERGKQGDAKADELYAPGNPKYRQIHFSYHTRLRHDLVVVLAHTTKISACVGLFDCWRRSPATKGGHEQSKNYDDKKRGYYNAILFKDSNGKIHNNKSDQNESSHDVRNRRR